MDHMTGHLPTKTHCGSCSCVCAYSLPPRSTGADGPRPLHPAAIATTACQPGYGEDTILDLLDLAIPCSFSPCSVCLLAIGRREAKEVTVDEQRDGVVGFHLQHLYELGIRRLLQEAGYRIGGDPRPLVRSSARANSRVMTRKRSNACQHRR